MILNGWCGLDIPGLMRTVTSRRLRRPLVRRVSVSKDLTGEDLPSILFALFPVPPEELAARDCSEPRVQSCQLNGGRGGKENNIRAFPSRF